jgi:hypothetical protein
MVTHCVRCRCLPTHATCLLALVMLATPAAGARPWQAKVADAPELREGFRLLYEPRPVEAREQFAAWQASHPDDPLPSAAEAASYLFEECYRQGVLTSEYFLDNKRFLGEVVIDADPVLRGGFFAATRRAEQMAQLRLKAAPEDANALFSMTLGLGMEADYAALVEKHQLESLSMIRNADLFARKLLAVDPSAADAYLTLGTANYVVGSLPALKRFVLRLKGIRGDKRVGIEQLTVVATRGRYLRPFAKILLGLAALREKNTGLARTQLMELVAEFPQNPLFARELARLDAIAPVPLGTRLMLPLR